jgi:hypothetical protein
VWHHPAGRAHDPDRKSDLCLNDHAVVTESQRRGVVELAPQANVLDRAIARHRALAVDLRDAADAEDRAAERLEELRAFLDSALSDWRARWGEQK